MKDKHSWETRMHPNMKNYVRRYDEYYTTYEHVDDIFTRYIPLSELRDKVIYCPCDSEDSNFIKYITSHKDVLGYKELIYTWDDYNTHLDLFEKADIIITNPPFSKLCKEFIPILNKVKKKFFILGSMITLFSYYQHFDDKEHVRFIRPDNYFHFIVPDSSLPDNPLYIYIHNLDDVPFYNEPLKLQEDKHKETICYGLDNEKQYINYDKLKYIPQDIDNEIVVPCTVLLEHNRFMFDILDTLRIKDKYIRVLVKRKPLTTN